MVISKAIVLESPQPKNISSYLPVIFVLSDKKGYQNTPAVQSDCTVYFLQIFIFLYQLFCLLQLLQGRYFGQTHGWLLIGL